MQERDVGKVTHHVLLDGGTVTKVRPMLAHSEPVEPRNVDLSQGPVWVSPKLDGVRCLQMERISMSRALKPLPNRYVQEQLAAPELDGLDGEVVVGSATAEDCINKTTSGVMSRDGEPDFTYYVFDCWHTPNAGYRQRYGYVKRRILAARRLGLPVELVSQKLCQTHSEIEEAVGLNYEAGYEGSIIRSFDGRYKYNRSTLREGLLLKVKESIDSEIRITGFEEMMHNVNAAKLDERGFTKRSTHKDNMVPAGTLGLLRGIDMASGEEIIVGPGKMTAEEKQYVWGNREAILGTIAKYRYAKHGIKDKPRFPRWIAWRDPIDM